ncbi:MAG TPA: 50S ribosomal protein L35 [Candidatus Paceibacterota bacterium]|nr:50S ribosomal protein L35 [Candidatus Paceibacterota bacterium]
MKTNKSFTKRLRVTKKGKVLARVAGHNHFNAKRSGKERQHKARVQGLEFTAAEKSRFLPNS